MALSTLTVLAGFQFDNTQKRQHLYCQLQLSSPTSTYPANGIPLDAVLLAVPGVTTNSGVKWTEIRSDIGSGYIYLRIPSTGNMMILQIPANGSLTTAGPLQQIPSSTNMQGIYNDVIACHATFLRNS
jgi:DNA mismatch repair protein MutH